MTNQRHGLPILRSKIDIVQDHPLRTVTKVQITQLHMAEHLRQIDCFGIVLPVGRLVEQIKIRSAPAMAVNAGVVLIPQHRNGREKQICHQKEADQVANVRCCAGMQHLITAH